MIIKLNLACAALYATHGEWDVVVTCAIFAALMWWLERPGE